MSGLNRHSGINRLSREKLMFKLALVIWLMLGTALAGVAVLVVVSDQSLLAQGMRTIPIAGIAGFIIALPLSYIVGKRIS